MSQNDSGNSGDFERNFLDSDVDLDIAHPSPGAEIYSRSSRWNLPPARSVGLALLVLLVTAGASSYYAYQQGLAEGQRSLPPIVLAEKTPLKIPAEQVPGGVAAPPDDLNIYGVMRGEATLNPEIRSPADNASGGIESLIVGTDDPFAALSGDAETARLPAKSAIQSLHESKGVEVSPPRPELNRAPQAVGTPKLAAKPVAKPKVVAKRQDYMVQLTAQTSRALARGSYSRLQKDYSDLLARRDPLIIRADLGNDVIFYRVNVPGFASRNSANEFCNNLKKRGQDCLVRKQP